jgi:hypothetical protein
MEPIKGGLTMQDEGLLAQYEREVCEAIRPFGEPERVNEARSDKQSSLSFLAVRVPAIQKVVRGGFSFYQRSASDILAIWSGIWFSSPYFEVMTASAMYYGLQRGKIDPDTWPTLSTWSSRIDNWAHADQLAGIYSYILAQGSTGVYDQIAEWNASSDQWRRRISLVSLIHYTGKNAVYLPPEQVLPLVSACLSDERPYVQKAVGWVLREVGRVYPQDITDFIVAHIDMPTIAFSRAIERRDPGERAALSAARKRQGRVGVS